MNETISLDIDLISEELYQLLLQEFYNQHPEIGNSSLDNWSITADVEN
jgi:hypothetical protein